MSRLEQLRTSRLERWGKTMAMKIFANSSNISPSEKKAIMDIIEWVKKPDNGNIFTWKPQPGKMRVISCLPYMIGFASQEGKIPRTLVDLQKPLLIIAMSKQCLAQLEKDLSGHCSDITMPYLQHLGIVTGLEVKQGAYYTTLLVKDELEANRVVAVGKRIDIILCSYEHCHHLPDNAFSIVLVYGNSHLSKEEHIGFRSKFVRHSEVLLFTGPPCMDKVAGANNNTECITMEESAVCTSGVLFLTGKFTVVLKC